MHVVALQFAKDAGDALAVRLAAVLGKTLLEARARLSEPEGGPSVLATFPGAAAATAYAEELRSRGFAVLVMAPEAVETEARRFLVRSFEIGEEALTAQVRGGDLQQQALREQAIRVAWSDVRLLIRGITRVEHKQIETVQRRQLSLGRAVLTGGLMVTRSVKTSKHEIRIENESFLHLYPAAGPPLVFRQSDLNFAGLRADLQPSVAANFARLVAVLRQASPKARYDERLATLPGQARLLGPSLPPERHLDLAVSLLSRALLAAPG